MSDNRVSRRLRQAVRERARNRCEYCRSPLRYSMAPFSVEHVIPTSRGGSNALENLALACQGCNGHKHAKLESVDPVSSRSVPLFNPRNDSWSVHFVWSEDYRWILGRTPTGRATVEALELNREGVVNLRAMLYTKGEHPPLAPDEA